MPYPFVLSYARKDAKVNGVLPDPHFEAFISRLNQRVTHLTGKPGIVDTTNILAGQDWPDELADALRTAHTLVCLYSPSYFESEYCGKEMQVFLNRRRNYIHENGGKKPANIIPVLWHSVPRRIPKTLPKIQYQATKLNSDRYGAWDLGDRQGNRELIEFADQIAFRVRDALDETPLPELVERPYIGLVRSAFCPTLPLQEFDLPITTCGPDAVTFVYASSTPWSTWPWSPPQEKCGAVPCRSRSDR